MNFSERIKTQRKNLGMTQADVAKKLFVTQQTVSSWENGKSYPDLNMLVQISDVYEVPVDSLLREDNELTTYLNRKKVSKTFNIYGDLTYLVYGFYNFDQSWMLMHHFDDASIWSLLTSLGITALVVYRVIKTPVFTGDSKSIIDGVKWWKLVLILVILALISFTTVWLWSIIPNAQIVTNIIFGIIFLGAGIISLWYDVHNPQ